MSAYCMALYQGSWISASLADENIYLINLFASLRIINNRKQYIMKFIVFVQWRSPTNHCQLGIFCNSPLLEWFLFDLQSCVAAVLSGAPPGLQIGLLWPILLQSGWAPPPATMFSVVSDCLPAAVEGWRPAACCCFPPSSPSLPPARLSSPSSQRKQSWWSVIISQNS